MLVLGLRVGLVAGWICWRWIVIQESIPFIFIIFWAFITWMWRFLHVAALDHLFWFHRFSEILYFFDRFFNWKWHILFDCFSLIFRLPFISWTCGACLLFLHGGGGGTFGISRARGQFGYTALMKAAEKGHADFARLLLDAGADTEAKTNVRASAGAGVACESCCSGRCVDWWLMFNEMFHFHFYFHILFSDFLPSLQWRFQCADSNCSFKERTNNCHFILSIFILRALHHMVVVYFVRCGSRTAFLISHIILRLLCFLRSTFYIENARHLIFLKYYSPLSILWTCGVFVAFIVWRRWRRHHWAHRLRAQYNRTALILAAENGRADCLRLLLDAGADKNAKIIVRVSAGFGVWWLWSFSRAFITWIWCVLCVAAPIIFSEFTYFFETVHFFVRFFMLKLSDAIFHFFFSDINLLRCFVIYLPFCMAASAAAHWHLLRAQDGWTALICAGYHGKADCVRLLLGSGADTEAKDNVRLISSAILFSFWWLCLIF
jgi:hypothetical protein